MNFQEGYIYHIYNQGNGGCDIFFDRENYLYFLDKVRTYLTPYLDILAWCLMPNHFHFMAFVRVLEISVQENGKKRSIYQSISILLRSYTRAINKRMERSGSLFRAHIKADCVNCPDGITPLFIMESGIARANFRRPELQYPQVCFNYIHQNPVKAGMVSKITDWEFSSAKDYAGLRSGTLIDRSVASEYVDIKLEQ